jgi:hypothetical protein
MLADYLKIKIQQGWLRIIREHPDINFEVSTPAVNAAWARLNAEYMQWAAGRNQVADVWKAFKAWEVEIVTANQQTAKMFG